MTAKANGQRKTNGVGENPHRAGGDDAVSGVAHRLDHQLRSTLSRVTLGMSPAHVAGAGLDWAMHLAMSPGKQLKLAQSGIRKSVALGKYAFAAATGAEREPVAEPPPHDRRFKYEGWDKWPFNILSQSYLLTREWWQEATTDIDGVTKDHEALVSFLAHQFLDAISPYNVPLTNPEVIDSTSAETGSNLQRGLQYLVEDLKSSLSPDRKPDTGEFRVGKDLGASPGKVIYRNRLIELIQYSPKSARSKVLAEPLLFLPPWIMKYYILDLSPAKSMVAYLVEQGHTVFMISWKNPGKDEADLGLNDYLKLGFMEALDVVNAVVPKQKVNAVGYCAGGTLLTIAAAAMARDGDDRLNTVSTFTAQTDCTEPGEIKMFLSDAQLGMLKDTMRRDGYLDGPYMAAAFNALNANALVWQPAIERYLLGKEPKLIDLMAWNRDVTRVPYRLHHDWLQKVYLENALAEDRYQVDDRNVHLSDIKVPMFFVGTTTDHVAPWKSVYKIHRLAPNSELTFCLTNGGHNAGIACGPVHPRRKHQVATRKPGEGYVHPDLWHSRTPTTEGSWWPTWNKWVLDHSGAKVSARPMGAAKAGFAPICDAPGTYVYL
jgi:polyhydroxyalkanoate synthase